MRPRLKATKAAGCCLDNFGTLNDACSVSAATDDKIQRGGCWIATVIDSSTTEGGYMAKPWAALPVSGSVILDSDVLRF